MKHGSTAVGSPSLWLLLCSLMMTPPLSAQDALSGIDWGSSLLGELPRLQELRSWTTEQGMAREAERLSTLICLLDPDDETARKALGFALSSDRRWERAVSWKAASKRSSRKRVTAYREREEGLEKRVLTAALARLEEAKGGTLWERRQAWKLLQDLAPRNEKIRTALGERKRAGRWRLAESQRTPRRRRRLRALVEELRRDEVPPKEIPLPEWTKTVTLPWGPGYERDGIAVFGSCAEDELRAGALLARRAWRLCSGVLSLGEVSPEGYRIFLLGNPNDRIAWLNGHPRMTEKRRRFLLPLRTGWAPTTWDVGVWPPSRPGREEWLVRQTFLSVMQRACGVQVARNGAIIEGVGLYLSFQLLGRRGTWYLQPSRYDRREAGLGDVLRDPRVRWLDEAKRRHRRKHRLQLRGLLGKGVEAMVPSDLLDAYVFAAWAIEGGIEGFPRLVKEVGRGRHHSEAIPRCLGMTPEEADERVMRWLLERKR